MTFTTQVEYHPDRPVVHFGSPPGATYSKPETELIIKGRK